MPKYWDIIEETQRKVLGLEMESFSMYNTLKDQNVYYLMVIAVQDYGDSNKDDSFREYGCKISASWVVKFALKYGKVCAGNSEGKKKKDTKLTSDNIYIGNNNSGIIAGNNIRGVCIGKQ